MGLTGGDSVTLHTAIDVEDTDADIVRKAVRARAQPHEVDEFLKVMGLDDEPGGAAFTRLLSVVKAAPVLDLIGEVHPGRVYALRFTGDVLTDQDRERIRDAVRAAREMSGAVFLVLDSNVTMREVESAKLTEMAGEIDRLNAELDALQLQVRDSCDV